MDHVVVLSVSAGMYAAIDTLGQHRRETLKTDDSWEGHAWSSWLHMQFKEWLLVLAGKVAPSKI